MFLLILWYALNARVWFWLPLQLLGTYLTLPIWLGSGDDIPFQH